MKADVTEGSSLPLRHRVLIARRPLRGESHVCDNRGGILERLEPRVIRMPFGEAGDRRQVRRLTWLG